ncbi:TonB-dependent receptor domain-containing protein [Thalassotalea marina]|uniref:TonB-dependent receptor n=1 Tax=Thalassotalea marina TaxID=1673741 RepID=A0A919BHR9_9GAMM|nr:TonB-dependent receptor [Thalassotalea marina]GHF88346.1 TonB-dependent receptor [Thalassotalea marina]
MQTRNKATGFKLSPLALLIGLGLQLPASAQEAQQQKAEEETIERVMVTGSRIKRTEMEGVVNVQSITSDDMIKSGFSSVYDALSNLPAANGAILGEVETGSYTPGAKELNLRGLGPEYTLILVNGKRLAYYPMPFGGHTNFVNLDMIPQAMVERIDIQTGGASAIYGSDAMAGVINIITKRGIEGHHVEAKYGFDNYDSNKTKSLSFVGGLKEGNFYLDYALEYRQNDGLHSGDRPFHDSVWDSPDPNSNRELNRSITVYSRDTEYLNNYVTEYCNTDANPHSKAIQHFIARNNYGPSCGWDETGEAHLINKNETASVYVNAQYDITDTDTFFATGYYVTQEKKGNRGSLFFYDKAFWDPDLTNKDGSQGGEVTYMWRKVLDQEYTSDGYGRTYDDAAYTISFGLEGTLGEFDYSMGFTRSAYDFNDQYAHSTVAGREKLLGPQLGTYNNLPIHRPDYQTWFGGFDKDTFFGLADWVEYKGESFTEIFNTHISGELYELDAGPIAFSFLLEAMKEGTKAIPDSRVINKEFTGLTGVITDGERKRYAAALELLVPVHETFDIEGAIRYDYYDDKSNVGGAMSTQLGFTYRPFEDFVFRSAVGTTFRGPDISAVYKGFSGNFGSGGDRVLGHACLDLANNGAVPGYDTDALTLTCATADLTTNPEQPSLNVNFESESVGDATLKEETGDTFTAGFVYELNEHFSFNIDYYQITINDKVALLDAGTILNINYECFAGIQDSDSELCKTTADRIKRYDAQGNGVDRLGNAITGDPYTPHSITEGYINAAVRKQSGIDFGIKGAWETEFGEFSYKFDLTKALSKKIKLRHDDPLIEYIDRQDNFDFKTIANAQVTWQKDDWSVSLLANRKGKLWNNANYGERDKLPAWTRYNLTIAKQYDDLRLLMSVTNLLNAMPPQDETFTGYPFYRSGAYDTLGRQFSFQAKYSF